MFVRVVKPFMDKYTKVTYQKGQEIEVNEGRYEELTSAALGPFVEALQKETPQEEPKTTENETKQAKGKKKAKK